MVADAPAGWDALSQLTPQQRQIVRLASDGLTSSQAVSSSHRGGPSKARGRRPPPAPRPDRTCQRASVVGRGDTQRASAAEELRIIRGLHRFFLLLAKYSPYRAETRKALLTSLEEASDESALPEYVLPMLEAHCRGRRNRLRGGRLGTPRVVSSARGPRATPRPRGCARRSPSCGPTLTASTSEAFRTGSAEYGSSGARPRPRERSTARRSRSCSTSLSVRARTPRPSQRSRRLGSSTRSRPRDPEACGS